MKKEDYKNHIDYKPFKTHNGQGPRELREPIPGYLSRPGDAVLTATDFGGVDNNSIIIFGRDRDPFRETKEGKKEKEGNDLFSIETVSGYSDYMGAGSIDIVVGRGAPYAVPGVGDYPNFLPPHYTTRTDKRITQIPLTHGEDHPGVVMDASRIYISQMSQVDEYFSIASHQEAVIDYSPHSSIMIKSDRVRMHARRDIKIIAGGDKGPAIDSNGYSINERGAIHLIAGNGDYGQQHPIPVGYNLRLCLKEVVQNMRDILTVLDNFIVAQKEVNAVLADHFHATGTGPTTQDPLVQGVHASFIWAAQEDQLKIHSIKTKNLLSLVNNYLEPNGSNYINSRYNTTT